MFNFLKKDDKKEIEAVDFKNYYNKGYFIIPYSTISEYKRNFWTIFNKSDKDCAKLEDINIMEAIENKRIFIAVNKKELILQIEEKITA
ncbi:hypothetical protein ACOL3H_07040 [Aliarcobacter butzleri]